MLAAFLRNDNDPTLATAAVLSGGICNVFGDWFFVFPCNMGLFGDGLATALGSVVSFIVSVARGLVISGLLILFLPVLFRAESIWLAMPIIELLVAVYVAIRMRCATAALQEKDMENK